jgi:hypothetical protein
MTRPWRKPAENERAEAEVWIQRYVLTIDEQPSRLPQDIRYKAVKWLILLQLSGIAFA